MGRTIAIQPFGGPKLVRVGEEELQLRGAQVQRAGEVACSSGPACTASVSVSIGGEREKNFFQLVSAWLDGN